MFVALITTLLELSRRLKPVTEILTKKRQTEICDFKLPQNYLQLKICLTLY